jgi:peptide/nickel transport system substrate-binding protein
MPRLETLIGGISRRRFLGTTAAVSAGLMLGGRQASAQGTTALRARSNSDIQNIDPINPAATADQNVMQAIFNRLVNFKPGTEWEWELDAADSIEVLDDANVRFTLKPNIMWTNDFGEMTTDDVKYSFERHARLESWTAVDWAPLKEVEVVDKYTGILRLNEPFAPLFWSTLPYGSGTIVCKKAVEQLEGEQFSVDPPATSGPYKIKEWTPKQKMVLDRNDGWPGDVPAYDEIHIFPIEDEKTAEIAFQAGELESWTLRRSPSVPSAR